MVYKTYLERFNTIIKGSDLNTGINEVGELVYGRNLTRILLYFDHRQVKHLIDNGTMPDISKMKHILKITNAGSVDFAQIHDKCSSSIDGKLRRRASSFDLIFFLIPKEWDRGKGYDYSMNVFNEDYFDSLQKDRNRFLSTDGSNWYKPRNGFKWDEEGVYSNHTLSIEYEKFSSISGSSVVIGRQRFDIGGENIELDITETFNKFISGELKNYGLGIAFSPLLERLGEDKNTSLNKVENYVGFFTDKTHLFFEPYVETIYKDYIVDDRANFVINKKNRLYLYCNIGGKPTDLDNLPTCYIKNDNDEIIIDDLKVIRQFRGVYYVELLMNHNDVEENTMFYDVWSNIVYQGVNIPDVELDFVTKPMHNWFNIDNTIHDEPDYTPLVAGINASENIFRDGEIRKVIVTARPTFTNNVGTLVDQMFYRLYIMDGTREITVIPYEPINMAFNENFFYLNCNMLIPQKYYLDIRFKYNGEVKTFKDVIHFKIVSNLNNKYA